MLDDGKVLDLLAFFEENHFVVLLLAETGVCANTHLSHGLQDASDFTSCPHSLPGVGVGAIFAPALKNSCFFTQFKPKSCNFRAWLLSVAGSLLLLGAFYAPHSGHSTKDRLAFFALVWEEWNGRCSLENFEVVGLQGQAHHWYSVVLRLDIHSPVYENLRAFYSNLGVLAPGSAV